MGNRVDKLITTTNLEAYRFPFSLTWLAIYDHNSQPKANETPSATATAVSNDNQCEAMTEDPHQSHRTLSQCIEFMLDNLSIPKDYPADTFGASIRKELEDQLVIANTQTTIVPVSDNDIVTTDEGRLPLPSPPGRVLLKGLTKYDRYLELFKSEPLIHMRAHLNDFELADEMIRQCWIHFRQTSKACLKKYGSVSTHMNSTPAIFLPELEKWYLQNSLACLFELFIDLDSPDREQEYYAIHFIHPNGQEYHISRIQKQRIVANPHNICVLTTPSEVNFERGPRLVKTIEGISLPNYNHNPQNDKPLFITIQGTPHESDYELWDLSKGKKSRAEQLPTTDPTKVNFLIFGQGQ
jgi:hypothetical protein